MQENVSFADDPALLAGVRVLDLSQFIPGPYCASMMSDLGADVLKVEPPSGDPMRQLGPLDADGVSPLYKVINRGKRVARIDLKSEAGRAAFRDLVDVTDVLLESYRPGVLDRLGFGSDALRRRNSRLVHCALSGYGQTGPLSLAAGHDVNYMALGGGLVGSGPADRPIAHYPPTADYASAIQAAFAIVSALLRRERTGEGASLDVSLMETVLGWQQIGLTAARRAEGDPLRAWMADRGVGLLNGGAAYYGIYATSDEGHVSLGAIEPKFWSAFCSAVGRPDWIGRQNESLPQTALAEELRALFASRTLADWRRLLDGVDCCFMPVEPLATVPDHPHIRARGLTGVMSEPEALVAVACPIVTDEVPAAARDGLDEITADEALRGWRSD